MSRPPNSPFTIAIIGGGLSGALVAVHLLRRAPAGTHIAMVEKNPPVGRGVAYATDCPEHLLNVPAARMSAFADEPAHFLEWVRRRAGRTGYPSRVAPGDFVPRRIYGDYLGGLFEWARYATPPGVSLEVIADEAVDLAERSRGGGRVVLASGRAIEAQRVVLALGNLPGEYPIRKSLPFYHGRRYVHVPWRADRLEGIHRGDDVLIVGQGLTATDIIVQLHALRHTGTIHSLSRRGLKPQVHGAGAMYPDFLADEQPVSVRELLHRVRAEVHRAETRGSDWRAVVDALRPHTAALWQGFSADERARFMRHLRPYWEIHRHRLAPAVAETIDRLTQEGRVKFHAGRLQSLRETATTAEAVFRRRGADEFVTLHVAKVINCTGPRTDYSKYQHPLLINLLARGLVDHDPLALGFHALPSGELFRYRGGPTGWLYSLGAPLKGVLWECTAVPEIRAQAAALAELLLASARPEVRERRCAAHG